MVSNPSKSRQLKKKKKKKKKPCISRFIFQLCKVSFGSLGGGNHYFDPTAQTAMQRHVVGQREHDKAQQMSWSSIASGFSS